MKRLLTVSTLLLMVLCSCQKDSGTGPCDTGNLEVINSTGITIYVSVGSHSTGINNGSSFTFTSIPIGNIQVAAEPMTGDPNVQWTYFSTLIIGCQTNTLKITSL